MPNVSTYTRTQIELLHKQGLHPAGIFTSLKSKRLSVSFSSVTCIIKKLCITGSVKNFPRSGRPQKLSIEAKAFIVQQMRNNDKRTSAQIKKKLAKHGVAVSSSTVWRSCKQQGWTLQQTRYCQLIRDANKIFSDECSISFAHYQCTRYQKFDKPTKPKPKPKHLLKVHVWAGISRHGATKICIFDGIMDADLFCNILETTLVPFIRENFPITGLCKITTWSTRSDEPRPSLRSTILTGGVLPRRVLTLTQLRTCGTSSSSSWNQRWSHATSKNWLMESRSSGKGESRRRNGRNNYIDHVLYKAELLLFTCMSREISRG